VIVVGHEKPPAPVIGVIGGSGIYDLDGLEKASWIDIETPFGRPSDQLLVGELEGQKVVFLPRHGRGHKFSPSTLNYRANICALKMAGVTDILSMSACGSLQEELPPGTFVIVDQFIDRTYARENSFFGTGLVAHVSMAHPVCSRLGDVLEEMTTTQGIKSRRGGTYLNMEGPQFSTLAESNLYRSLGCAVVGMTNATEAKLAKEAEMCYATIAMVTDYDCWHPSHGAVSVDQVIKVLMENADKARQIVRSMIPKLKAREDVCTSGCHRALDSSIITAPEARDRDMINRLMPIAGRILG